MHRRRLVVGMALVVMALALPASAGDESDIAGRVVNWEKQYNAGDLEAVAKQYTEDATRMPYQAPTIEGRAAIVEQMQGFKEVAPKIALTVTAAESHGAMAWAQGTYELFNEDGSTFQKGKWMNVSRKVGKEWLIEADIWNTDAP